MGTFISPPSESVSISTVSRNWTRPLKCIGVVTFCGLLRLKYRSFKFCKSMPFTRPYKLRRFSLLNLHSNLLVQINYFTVVVMGCSKMTLSNWTVDVNSTEWSSTNQVVIFMCSNDSEFKYSVVGLSSKITSPEMRREKNQKHLHILRFVYWEN